MKIKLYFRREQGTNLLVPSFVSTFMFIFILPLNFYFNLMR